MANNAVDQELARRQKRAMIHFGHASSHLNPSLDRRPAVFLSGAPH
jgi:hypothetical protein